MELHKVIHKLKKDGLTILGSHQGIRSTVIEVKGTAPAHLPTIIEIKNGMRRTLRPAKYCGNLLLFIEGETSCHKSF